MITPVLSPLPHTCVAHLEPQRDKDRQILWETTIPLCACVWGGGREAMCPSFLAVAQLSQDQRQKVFLDLIYALQFVGNCMEYTQPLKVLPMHFHTHIWRHEV